MKLYEHELYEYELPNKTKIIHVRVPYFKTVGIGIGTNCGAIHDPRGKEGSAHLLEHLKTRRGKKYSAHPYHPWKFLEEKTTPYWDASTSYDTTLYQLKLLKEDSEKGFDVLSDVHQNHEFRKEDFELERKTVEKEIIEIVNQRNHFLLFLQNLWKNTRLSTSIGGTLESIKNIRLEDLVKLSTKYYVGRRSVVVVAGNLKKEKVLKLAKEYFGGLDEGKEIHDNIHINLQQKGKFVEKVKNDNDYVFIITGRKFGKLEITESCAIDVILNLIDKNIWEKLRGSGEIYSFEVKREIGKWFEFVWVTFYSKLNEVERILKKFKECVRDVCLDENKIQNTKTLLRKVNEMFMEEDVSWKMVNSIIEWYFKRRDDWKEIVFNYPKLIEKVTPEIVKNVYEKYFDIDNWVTVVTS